MINIPKSITDPFYRYRREEIKISNQKLGIYIDNLDEIANSIYINPKTIMKYIQKKTGSKSKDNILYNKNITKNELDNILEELINIIICNKCNNPEIKFNKEKKKLFKSCAACGNTIEILDDFKKMLINEG
tara:strand:+ start:1110 stop:1502 length:393 start_codon:yes stop_codon:yes gene_type:complete